MATGISDKAASVEHRNKLIVDIQDFLDKNDTLMVLQVLSQLRMFSAKDFVKYYGTGALAPNTIIMGESKNFENREK